MNYSHGIAVPDVRLGENPIQIQDIRVTTRCPTNPDHEVRELKHEFMQGTAILNTCTVW